MRGFLQSAFSAADEAGKYNGLNPVTKVKRRKVPERAPMFLEAWEADRLLQLHPLKDIWGRLFATALFTPIVTLATATQLLRTRLIVPTPLQRAAAPHRDRGP